MAKPKPKKDSLRFNKNDQIGTAAAEDDAEFLSACFVDTGDLQLLEDHSDRRQIVLGRTGAGKSALLETLCRRRSETTIRIRPDSLALTYVANSTILGFFGELGVNLDPLFKLLWRHVFVVEVLEHCFLKRGLPKSRNVLDKIIEMFAGPSRKDTELRDAAEYLKQWGGAFWQETETKVKEITRHFEQELASQAQAALSVAPAKVESIVRSGERIGEQERKELISRGQEIVSKTQVKDLSHVTHLLESVLKDKQRGYYIVIDGLDENWVEERLRYKLIMALVLTAREFVKIGNVKIIVALRRDLIERVFRITRDSGFQEEKFTSLYLPLSWTQEHILDVLDKRIGQLFSRRYTSQPVTHKEVLPRRYRGKPIGDYLFAIAPRPRDIIAHFNTCILAAANSGRIGTDELKIAEGEYSRLRLRALGDEWSGDYPSLLDFAVVLSKRPSSFKLGEVSESAIADLCLGVAASNPGGTGRLQSMAMSVVDCLMDANEFRVKMAQIFYHVGLVGLKVKAGEKVSWVDELGRSISAAEIDADTSIVVHRTYCRALGVRIQE